MVAFIPCSRRERAWAASQAVRGTGVEAVGVGVASAPEGGVTEGTVSPAVESLSASMGEARGVAPGVGVSTCVGDTPGEGVVEAGMGVDVAAGDERVRSDVVIESVSGKTAGDEAVGAGGVACGVDAWRK
jgi:hypothetical protein